MPTFSRLIAAAAAALSLTVGAAHAQSSTAASAWSDTVAAARKEGAVVVYTAKSPADIEAVLKAFSAKHPGIRTDYLRMVSQQLAERVDQELRAGKLGVDLVWNSEVFWQRGHAKAGRLAPPTGPSAARWPAQRRADGVVELSVDPIGILYNTAMVKRPVTDWDSLMQEEYRGRVGVQEVTGSIVVSYYDLLRKLKGEKYLTDLAALRPRLYPSSVPMGQAVAAGELAWTPFSYAWVATNLKAKGATVEFVIPKSGTVVTQQSAIVFKDAPHPAAAQLLLDFMMSEEGQRIINGDGKAFSWVDVPGSLQVDPKALNVMQPEDVEPAKSNDIRQTFSRIFRK